MPVATLTPLSTPGPRLGQSPTDFATNADKLVSELPTMVTQLNTSIANINTAETAINTNKTAAQTAATSAQTSATAAESSKVNAEAVVSSARAEILQANGGLVEAGVYGAKDGVNKAFTVLGLDWDRLIYVYVGGLLLDSSAYTRVGNVLTLSTAPLTTQSLRIFGEIDPLDIAPAGYKTLRIETIYNSATPVTLTCACTGATAQWLDDAGTLTTAATYALTGNGSPKTIRLFVPNASTTTHLTLASAAIKRLVLRETLRIGNLQAQGNQLSDLRTLSLLRPTGVVYFHVNQIVDLSFLTNWRPLGTIYLYSNLIQDFAPLFDMRPVGVVHLYSNKALSAAVDAAIDWVANQATGVTNLMIHGTNAAPSTAACADIATIKARGAAITHTAMSTPCP